MAKSSSSQDVRIRDATKADAEAVAGLLRELGYECNATQAAARIAAGGADAVLLALSGDEPVGLATLHVTRMLQHQRPVARVTALVVNAAARGRGIGRLLLDRAVALGRERGCGLVELTSATGRMEAHGFYEANGFGLSALRFHRVLD